MLELGQYERQGHEMIGARVARVADILLTLGVRAHMIAASAHRGGMRKENILEFEEIEPVMEWLENNLSAKDAVLIKGSHGLRMDRIVSSLEISR